MNVLLVAEEAAGMRALQLVAGAEHRLVAAMTSPDKGVGRGATVAATAQELGVPVWAPELVRDPSFAQRVAGEGVDLLLNVHSLHIAAPEVVSAPRIGSFNLHPGPLPEYAGLDTPSWAIYRGERRHGVTLHWMAPDVDVGPIAYSASFEIGPDDTGLTVSVACVHHGLPLVARLIETAAEDPRSIPAIEQDLSRHRWFGREAPHGGRVPWALPARRVVDFVRACDYGPFPSPWGRPRTRLEEVEFEVLKVKATGEPAAEPAGTIGTGGLVAAADEWIAVERLRVDGRGVDPAEALEPGRRLASAT